MLNKTNITIKTLGLTFMLATLFSCNKVDKLTQFNIGYTSEITIPANTILSIPIDILTPEVQTNSESKFNVENTSKDLIEEVKLTELTLDLKSPSNADFSFLNEIKVFITADGLGESEIAAKTNIPNNSGASLTLETSDLNLMEYIKKDEFKLRVETITDEAITQDHVIDIKTTFFVDAKILGQ